MMDVPKRPRGRPPKAGSDATLRLKLAKNHYDYLKFIVDRKNRLGSSVNEAAVHILTREIDAMMRTGYHDLREPWKDD